MEQVSVDGVILWSPALELGFPEIDAQHRRWVALLNDFIVSARDGGEVAATYKCLLAVLDYTQAHFRAEEAILNEMGYAFLDDHMLQHRTMTDELLAYNYGERDPEEMIEFFRGFLPRWILYHIGTADRAAFDDRRQGGPRRVGFMNTHDLPLAG